MDRVLTLSHEDLWKLIDHVFSSGVALDHLRGHAVDFALLIREADPFIQRSTGAVCPQCRQVCCINRHSRYTPFDSLYLRALGEKKPARKAGIADSEPCQFLSLRGCRLERFLRPYRCTWYFCTPLLEYVGHTPARQYRGFISLLEQISLKRELLVKEFISVAKKGSLTVDIPLHEFY